MDLNLLSLFVDIAEAASLSAAARRGGVTRSHVSQRLQLLERQLGTQLVRRSTRRLELTESGQVVYEHGVRIRQEAEAVSSSFVGANSRRTQGLVRVSVPTGLGRLIVAPLLLAFQREHPGISLTVRFTNRVDDLIAAQIDVALKITSVPPQDHEARGLARVSWRLCAAAAYLAERAPIRRAADLERHEFLSPPSSAGRVRLRLRNGGQTSTVTVRPRLQSEDFCFLLDALQAGMGIGLLPDYMIGPGLADGRIVPILPDALVNSPGEKLYLMTTRSIYPPQAQRLLVAYFSDKLSGLLQPDPRWSAGADGK